MKLYWLIIISLFIYSCDEGITGPSDEDISQSNILIGLANQELEDAFQVLYNPDILDNCDQEIDCLQLINFTDAHTYFEEALSLNPDNLDAHFGIGITNLLMITQDQDMYDSINEWINYFDDDAIAFSNDNIFPTIDNFLSFDFSNMLNLIPIQNNILSYNNQNPPPEFSDIQDLLETSFLNRLTESINHFDIVLATDYTFILSGAMQGDNSLPSLDIDNTEIYLLKTQMHLFSSIINLIIAYNFDIPHYEIENIECVETHYYDGNDYFDWYWTEHYYVTTFADYDWLDQDSDFLSIQKENALPSVHSNLNQIYLSLTSAIEYLQNETDSQVNDMILASDLSIDEILSELENFNSLVNENQTMEDGLTVNFSNFLNSPVNNLKSLIPEYELEEVTDTCLTLDGQEVTYTNPSIEFTATSWQEFKNQIDDPTMGGLFPEFSVDDMLDYMYIECDDFDFGDCD